jgi:hypothetical protein
MPTLTNLKLQNFRCFSDHKVELQQKTLLVGRNNAGKSTCVEALRLVSLVTERLDSLHIHAPPSWTDLPIKAKGVAPSLESIEIHANSLFNNYADPPAVVSAQFDHGSRVDVHIGPDLELHAVIYNQEGEPAFTRSRIKDALIPRVSILPQIAPLQERELVREDAYVRQNIQTSRGSLHFRNQLRLFRETFPAFQKAVEESWSGIAVRPIVIPSVGRQKENPIELLIRDGDFTAEAAWTGHGLQMWLQTMWFLTRTRESAVLILDEPDVYMHADLQRRLVRMLMHDGRQFIIATHSPEMLAEVEPDSVVVLDRKRRVSRAATSSKAVQALLLRVGSVHNLSLARLAGQRRLLLVEGKDVGLLKRIQNVIDPSTDRPIDTVPNVHIGGWTGWPGALTLARFFEKNVEDDIEIHCLLDRDYFPDTELAKRHSEAKAAGIELTIWGAKELENYLLVPEAIARVIAVKAKTKPEAAEVENAVNVQIEALRDDAFASTIDAYRSLSPDKSTKTATLTAKPAFETRWNETNGRGVVSGKDALGGIFSWVQKEYKISLSIAALIHELHASEVHKDIKDVIRAVTSRR